MPRKPNPGETLWSEALVARLSELWLSGTASGEIGRRLGITRSAVMGKLRRLDMLCRDRRPPPSMPPQMPVIRRNKRQPKSPDSYFVEFAGKPAPPPPPPEPAYGTLKLLDLRHNSCRWPEGERPDYRFCGRPRHHESSYCETHSAMAHSRGSQRDYDRAADAALGGKLFASRAGVME